MTPEAGRLCQCPIGCLSCTPCQNEMTAEDLLCGECREEKKRRRQGTDLWHCHKWAAGEPGHPATVPVEINEKQINALLESVLRRLR